jgi:hypothetical protein
MKLDSKNLKKLILKEMRMMQMAPMHGIGHMKSLDHDDYDQAEAHAAPMMSKGGVSREDCCAAIMALVECCSCPMTKQAIIECCNDLMSGQYGSH